MAKNKKPAKSYKPKPVYNHTLIGGMAVFDPLIKAVNRLIETDEVIVDMLGVSLVATVSGEGLGFSDGLLRIVDLMELYKKRFPQYCGVTRVSNAVSLQSAYDCVAIRELARQLSESDVDLTVAKEALSELQLCKISISRITPSQAMGLVTTVKTMHLLNTTIEQTTDAVYGNAL